MKLEKFFEKGNKLAVFGSAVCDLSSANDVDFTLFTHGARLPFSCEPQHNDEIIECVDSLIGEPGHELDFFGRGRAKIPYDIDKLPDEDERPDVVFLTGMFTPDDEFIKNHYKSRFGANYLPAIWMRFSGYIQDMPKAGVRMDKRDKDLGLLLRAAEKLTQEGYAELKDVVGGYRDLFKHVKKKYFGNRRVKYISRVSEMIPEFVSEVTSLL